MDTREAGQMPCCCKKLVGWINWCSPCCRQQSYSQAFLEERTEARSASATSSPYQAPVQATSSGLHGSERTALLPNKSTELHSTGPARQGSIEAGKLPKWPSGTELPSQLPSVKKGAGKASLTSKGRNASGLSLAASEEGDFCSTCLEPYSEENPAIWTKCNHHFHLACIYEWLERKQTCPICEREMSFEEIIE